MEFFKNIYRSGNQKHACPCESMREVKNFTFTLLKETRPNLSEEDMAGVANRLILEASKKLEKEKNEKAAAKRYFFKKRSSSSSSRSATPSPSTSRRKTTPQAASTPEAGSETESQLDLEVTPKCRLLPKGRSSIPKFQFQKKSEKKPDVSSEDLPLAMNNVQLIPRHLCNTTSKQPKSAESSRLPLPDRKLLVQRKIELLSGRATFKWLDESDTDSEFVKSDTECSDSSEEETVV